MQLSEGRSTRRASILLPTLGVLAGVAALAAAGVGGEPRWPLEGRLFADDSVFGWSFGEDAALDGTTAIIGAKGAGPGSPTLQGAAYVFVHDGDGWVAEAKLEAFDGEEDDRFGKSVGIAVDRVVVGADRDDQARGAAYVFKRSGITWELEQKLLASDGDELDSFGFSADMLDNAIIVGAHSEEGAIMEIGDGCQGSGAAYVFERSGETWVETAKLFDADGLCGDLFGWSVALDGETALVGAPSAEIGPNRNRGAASVYRRIGGSWLLEQKLLASDGTDPDQFGWSVALDRDTAVIGAFQKFIDGTIREGAAYVFQRSGSTWTEVQRLTASDGVEDLQFGSSVAVHGGVALIGAQRHIGNQNFQGVVYEFRRIDGVWQEIGWFTAPMGNGLDSFGHAIDLEGDRLLVSNPGNIVVNPQGGTAWVFRRPTLFSDGFETGDTSRWTSAFP